ncbi:MAG: prolyl oligopeptidase family serine peptidase [Prolixibacteraceae bacterium]
MRSITLLILVATICPSLILNAQKSDKKPLTTRDFASWKTINNQAISNDGKTTSFEINQQKGDGILILKSILPEKSDTFARGFDARISAGSDFIVYKIKQPEDSIRSAKKKKLKKEQMPKDSLGILVFNPQKAYKFSNLKQFSLPKEADGWVAFLTDMKKSEKKTEKTGEKKPNEAKTKPATAADPAADQKFQLSLFQAATGDTINFQNVTEFFYAPSGHKIAFVCQTKDSLDRCEVSIFDTDSRKNELLFKNTGTAKKISLNKQGNRYGFLFSADTIKEKCYGLYAGTLQLGAPKVLPTSEGSGIPKNWSPSDLADLSFSDNGELLFYGDNLKPSPEPKDSLLDDEKPALDIWSWKDKELQPEQKINLEKEKKRTFKAVYSFEIGKCIQLGDSVSREIRTIQKGNGSVALGIDQSPYKLASSWTGDSNGDYYLIQVKTGERTKILQDKSMVSLSPGGKFVVWYSPADSAFYAKSTQSSSSELLNLTSKIPAILCDERWDSPSDPNPYGIAGWAENDKYIFIYDRFDIWRIDTQNLKNPVNITNQYGRKNFIRLRYLKLDPEEEFITISKPTIVQAFNEKSKSEGFLTVNLENVGDPILLTMLDKKIDKVIKAKQAPVVIWTRETVSEFPNLWTSDTSFEKCDRLSDANPQQKSFVWPKVQLVHWTSFSGKALEGLLYLPETMDSTKKYPMIVYFYERNADNLNAFTAPSPTRSTVNRTHYTSNDYLIFIPDITYETGNPGKSAFDAVISGTQYLCNRFQFVDREKIGVQGQSWGGYQTAWLITQTNLFKAAMAGAPVSNMTSAYGGIRWQVGVSRMFQYEKEQSRIGGTLWEKPLSYIDNSPLFFVPKIETPLLIMHNDNDGAVPWYQGIELFTAMRRLNKPAWMLTYNNEEHNLKAESWANRMDLTIRMKQFFDHYLKGEPMPDWMKNGLPATRKGKELRY